LVLVVVFLFVLGAPTLVDGAPEDKGKEPKESDKVPAVPAARPPAPPRFVLSEEYLQAGREVARAATAAGTTLDPEILTYGRLLWGLFGWGGSNIHSCHPCVCLEFRPPPNCLLSKGEKASKGTCHVRWFDKDTQWTNLDLTAVFPHAEDYRLGSDIPLGAIAPSLPMGAMVRSAGARRSAPPVFSHLHRDGGGAVSSARPSGDGAGDISARPSGSGASAASSRRRGGSSHGRLHICF